MKAMPRAIKAVLYLILLLILSWFSYSKIKEYLLVQEFKKNQENPFRSLNSPKRMEKVGASFIELSSKDENAIHAIAEMVLRTEYNYFNIVDDSNMETIKNYFIYTEEYEAIKARIEESHATEENFHYSAGDGPCSISREVKKVEFSKPREYAALRGSVVMPVLIPGLICSYDSRQATPNETYLFIFKKINDAWKIEAQLLLIINQEGHEKALILNVARRTE